MYRDSSRLWHRYYGDIFHRRYAFCHRPVGTGDPKIAGSEEQGIGGDDHDVLRGTPSNMSVYEDEAQGTGHLSTIHPAPCCVGVSF